MLSPPSLLHPPGKEVQRPVAHECLGEVLRVLRQVISTYPLLNTVEILTAAGKLISRVKGAYHSAVSYRCLKKKTVGPSRKISRAVYFITLSQGRP